MFLLCGALWVLSSQGMCRRTFESLIILFILIILFFFFCKSHHLLTQGVFAISMIKHVRNSFITALANWTFILNVLCLHLMLLRIS
ncbi:hypothetical protein Gotur_030706 [Gossypium turneri]